jgi:hypothetical protein
LACWIFWIWIFSFQSTYFDILDHFLLDNMFCLATFGRLKNKSILLFLIFDKYKLSIWYSLPIMFGWVRLSLIFKILIFFYYNRISCSTIKIFLTSLYQHPNFSQRKIIQIEISFNFSSTLLNFVPLVFYQFLSNFSTYLLELKQYKK